MPTLVWSLAKAGRRDPVEVWGPAGRPPSSAPAPTPSTSAAAHAWDMESLRGHPGQSGAHTEVTEVPWDRTATVYEPQRRHGLVVPGDPHPQRRRSATASTTTGAASCSPATPDRATRWSTPATAPTCSSTRRSRPRRCSPRRPASRCRFAEQVVNGAHTSPDDGRQGVRPRRRADVGDVAPRRRPRGRRPGLSPTCAPSTTARSRSPRTSPRSTISADAVVTRQSIIDPVRVAGRSARPSVTGPPMSPPPEPPAWWADALLTD